MKKITFAISILLTSAVYAANNCEPLENVCKAFGYKTGETKVEGKDLYNDCVNLIVSGFAPSDINMNHITANDIKTCGDQRKAASKKK